VSNRAADNLILYKVDVKLCYPIIEAVINTLTKQCKVNVRTLPPSFKNQKDVLKPDITIMTSLASESSIGSLSICMKNDVFLNLMGRMLGETFSKLTPELHDGALELMNIIFNQAKKTLSEKRYSAIRSIPQIIFGKDLRLYYLTRGQIVVLYFSTEAGDFSVEVCSQSLEISDSV
jgi:CheY-specific phosphatase CheX